MAIQLNHTIVGAVDAEVSACWMPTCSGSTSPFTPGNSGRSGWPTASTWTSPRWATSPLVPQHYAFLISEAEFDDVHGRLLVGEHDLWRSWPRYRARSTTTTAVGGILPQQRTGLPRGDHPPLRQRHLAPDRSRWRAGSPADAALLANWLLCCRIRQQRGARTRAQEIRSPRKPSRMPPGGGARRRGRTAGRRASRRRRPGARRGSR